MFKSRPPDTSLITLIYKHSSKIKCLKEGSEGQDYFNNTELPALPSGVFTLLSQLHHAFHSTGT